MGTFLETLDIQHRAFVHHHLYVAGILAGELLNILIGEREHLLRSTRNDPATQGKGKRKQERCRHQIRTQETLVTHSGRQDCYDLAVTRHLGGEEDNRDEDKQLAEHVQIIGDKVQIVVKHYLP